MTFTTTAAAQYGTERWNDSAVTVRALKRQAHRAERQTGARAAIAEGLAELD